MQQMAGHMNLLNPFVFNQFGPYGAYAQVNTQRDPPKKHETKKFSTIKNCSQVKAQPTVKTRINTDAILFECKGPSYYALMR